MKYIYIVNRFALKEKTDRILDRLKKVSDELQREYEIIVNEKVEDVKKSLEPFKDTHYIITSIGGDGSINLLLNDIVDTPNILSFVPHGTGNDFCRYCLENLEDGIHDVDIVKINERYFINVACFGIDADIANDDNFIHNPIIPPALRYHAGVVHYFLTYKPRIMRVEVNGQTIEKQFTTIAIGNAQYYGGGYHVSPNSDIKDGKLEVLLADRLNKVRMAKVILSMKNAGHLKDPAVTTFVTDRLTVQAPEAFSSNIDGEPLNASRFEISVVPKGYRIEVNKEFIKQMSI